MTPDDERPQTTPDPTAEDAQASANRDEPAGDDLEALAGALPSPTATEPPLEADEDLDLGALAAGGQQRLSTQASDSDARLSLAASDAVAPGTVAVESPARRSGAISASVAPAAAVESVVAGMPPRASAARPAWLLPLLLGLMIGAGAAAAVFLAAPRPAEPTNASAPLSTTSPRPVASSSTGAGAATITAPVAPSAAAIATPGAAAAGSTSPMPQAPPPSDTLPKPRRLTASEPALRPAFATAAEPALPASSAAAGTPELPGDPLADGEAQAPDKVLAPGDASAKSGSSMDALLDQALSPTARRDELARRQQLALAEEQLPLTPSREDVTQAMTVLLPAIRGCAMGQSGMATAGIVVRGDGRVAGVEIAGAPFAGTASGRCMEGVIRRARFTPFQQPILRIKFPLAIQ